MMTIDEMIAVLQAAKEGKKIQSKRHGTEIWFDKDDGSVVWSFDLCDFRVKPQLREWWMTNFDGSTYPDLAAAQRAVFEFKPCDTQIVHVREVLD